MADKQLDEMAATLFPVANRLILTRPRNPRAASVENLQQLAQKYAPAIPTEIALESNIALAHAVTLSVPRPVICVTGSLYLVGEVRQWLEEHYGQTGHFS